MPSQATILVQRGLVKAETATQKDWQTIDSLRDKRFSLPLEWERIQQILTNHPSIRPYLYLSTGLDGLVLLNTDTGETASAQPLIFEILSNENDTMFQMVEQYVCRWDETTPTKTLIRQGRIDEAKQQIEHATMLAPTALMELVYQLVPWKELADGQYQRLTALNVRKNEEYPTRQFDRHLVRLLRQTKPCVGGEGSLERTFDKPITVYRGEIDKSVHFGLSWTTSLNVAQKFAERFGKEGTIYSLVLKPEEILAAYADDGEQEVLAKVDASRVEVV
ncbi:hypothetical protein [Bifidobacterium catenulatum]|uniref:Uncharacterized protein n=1 Tax=Bifidobacterium catenulatum subsp. kashiwanohense TaxID=630129 RepID=A0AA43P4X6_9BIFI|nr:hypothetical protein [Bifidobacterium catenulatum]MDH7889019.1 hypothetical protein [Bifidobacterium catenulatum subsp. kashiwanohense]